MVRRQHKLNMLDGPLMPNLLRFMMPLMLASILQMMYNSADMVVVGRFAPDGEAALAAVGAIGPISAILIHLGTGFATGVGVKVAQYIGADDRRGVFGVVHTGVALGFAAGFALGVIGFVLAEPLLVVTGTPVDVLDGAIVYMRIRMIGQVASLPFSLIAGTFRAAGNTTRPTVILCITGVLNVLLNMVFVIGCGMGIEGVGLATLCAEIVNLILGIASLCKTDGVHKLYIREIRIYKQHMIDICKIGIPASIQAIVYNISNMYVQISLNTFPSVVGAGNVAASNLTGFINVGMSAIGQASITFIGQNMGAKNYRRIGKVNCTCSLLTLAFGSLGLALYLLGPWLIPLYNTNPEVVGAGMARLQVEGCLIFLLFIADIQFGALRAMGKSATAMALSIFGSVGVQLMWILLVFNNCPETMGMLTRLKVLYMCYPVSFIVNVMTAGTVFIMVYRRLLKSQKATTLTS